MPNKKIKFTDIKTLEDVFKATGRPATPEFSDMPEDLREYFRKHYEAALITEAINGDWRADWDDTKQKKYIPWFYNNGSSGFAFGGTDWYGTIALAGYASRLCFETAAKAEYAGRQFTQVFLDVLMK